MLFLDTYHDPGSMDVTVKEFDMSLEFLLIILMGIYLFFLTAAFITTTIILGTKLSKIKK